MRRQGRGSLSRGHRRPATHAARTGRRPSRRHRRYTSLSYNAHPEPHRYNAAYNAAVQGLATLGQPPDDAHHRMTFIEGLAPARNTKVNLLLAIGLWRRTNAGVDQMRELAGAVRDALVDADAGALFCAPRSAASALSCALHPLDEFDSRHAAVPRTRSLHSSRSRRAPESIGMAASSR